MPLITWNDSLSVRVQHLDDQHKTLVDLLNRFHESMLQGTANQVLSKIAANLEEYTKMHFSTEEVYMESKGFPGLAGHKRLHADFIRKVVEIREGIESGRHFLSAQVSTFLKEWINSHIKGEDQKYSPK